MQGLKQTVQDAAEEVAAHLWATACETALRPAGTFWSAYCGNRDEAGVIDADPIATAMCAVMATWTVWTGTASDLLGALAEVAGERIAKSKTWPDGPRALAGRLRWAATFLRKIGIEIGFGREGRARTRTISITTPQPSATPEKTGAQQSAPSASSARPPKSNPANGFSAQFVRTVACDADGNGNGNPPMVRANPLKNNAGTAADGADTNLLPQSGPEKPRRRGRWTAADWPAPCIIDWLNQHPAPSPCNRATDLRFAYGAFAVDQAGHPPTRVDAAGHQRTRSGRVSRLVTVDAYHGNPDMGAPGHFEDQPHEPEYCDQTSEPKTGAPVWGENASWWIVPMPGHTWPKAVSLARRVEPRRETGCQKRKFQERRLDGRCD